MLRREGASAVAELAAHALTIDLVAHMDAGDRKKWQRDQNERPLTDLGRRQAAAIGQALAAEPVDVLYAGRALRCRQTLEPLAEHTGLPVDVLPELGEDVAWRNPDGWESESWEVAFAAGSAARGIAKLRALHHGGRVVACSHGHVIPAYIAFLSAAHGLRVPQVVLRVPPAVRRGQWYRLRFAGDDLTVELREAPAFPSE